jgi:hypothetical protein
VSHVTPAPEEQESSAAAGSVTETIRMAPPLFLPRKAHTPIHSLALESWEEPTWAAPRRHWEENKGLLPKRQEQDLLPTHGFLPEALENQEVTTHWEARGCTQGQAQDCQELR